MRDPRRSATFHPDVARKSRARVWIEQLGWLLRHGEVNRYYWAYGFDVAGFRQWHDYLPYREFMRMRDKANRGVWVNGRPIDLRSFLRDKLLFKAFLKGMGIPSAPLLAYGHDGRITWLEPCVTEPAETILAREGLEAFCKDVVGECAGGVWHVRVSRGRLVVNDGRAPADDVFAVMRTRHVVFEGPVRQHADLARLHPQSVNTLRLITVLAAGRAEPFSCILRVGCGGNRVDNTAKGGVFMRVDLEAGVLRGDGYYWPDHGTRTPRHPDTGIAFDGYPLPFVREAVDLALDLHSGVLCGMHSIGWDLVIAEDGPLVLEANDNWEIPHAQMGAAGGQRRRFEALCAAGAARTDGPCAR